METEFGRRTKKETETYSIYIYVCVWVFEFFLTSDYKQSIYTFLIHVFILHTNTHIHIYIYRKVCALSYKRVYGMQKGCCIVWVVQCSLWPCFDTFLSNPKLLFLLSLSLSIPSLCLRSPQWLLVRRTQSVWWAWSKNRLCCAPGPKRSRSNGSRFVHLVQEPVCVLYTYIHIFICICMYVVYLYGCIYVCMYACMNIRLKMKRGFLT